MALTWDNTAVKDIDSLTDDESATIEALIWATMAVGINHITLDNARDFYARVSFWEKIAGAYRFDPNGPVYLTPEDVLRFVGLRTNASPKTKAQFYKSAWDCHIRWNVPREV